MLLACGITDSQNEGVKGIAPFLVGLIVTGLTTSYAYNSGAALNPARDLSPRIFTAIAGWGRGVFR